ncbi:FUSC family protein, partial [Pseudomonas syringae group genomosp. 7]|uniref:FUSC family protein n=1 Tax=Pseudomonas syringae group genomosp. 7 TaxID=251699 RepID=UPI00377002B1
NPQAVFDIAVSRTVEIFVGIFCAAVVGAMFWPRRLAPVFQATTEKWFGDASTYSQRFISLSFDPEVIGVLRNSMVGSFN